jgi:Family of unknown function (DUF6412)
MGYFKSRLSEVPVAAAGRFGALALIVSVWQIAGHVLAMPAGVPALAATMLATTLLAGVLVAMLASGGLLAGAALPLISRAAALRRKSWPAAFIRQRDPDPAGRSRPRAPAAGLAAPVPQGERCGDHRLRPKSPSCLFCPDAVTRRQIAAASSTSRCSPSSAGCTPEY